MEEAEQWLEKGKVFEREKSFDEAFKCFERGFELSPGHPELLCALAMAYHMGYGVQEDEEQAVALYLKAAEQGYAKGQVSLGWHYACGEGVPKDEIQAFELWREAAAHDASAAENYEDLLAIYREAAEEGDQQAKLVLDEVMKMA
jgi:TPR repeat protein